MKRKKIRSSTHMTIALALTLALLYLACMGALTWATAILEIDRLENGAEGVRRSIQNWMSNTVEEDEPAAGRDFWEDQGFRDYTFLTTMRNCNIASYSLAYDSMEVFPFNDDNPQVDRAILIYDRDGQLVFESGSYIYFYYVKEEELESYTYDSDGSFGYINLDSLEDSEAEILKTAYGTGAGSIYSLKIEGTIDGEEITPVSIESLDYVDAQYNAFTANVTQEGECWQQIFQSDRNGDSDIVTIYTVGDPDATFIPGESSAASAETSGGYKASEDNEVWADFSTYFRWAVENGALADMNSSSLLNFTWVDSQFYGNWEENAATEDAVNADTDASDTVNVDTAGYRICYACSSSPLRCAVHDLTYIYLMIAAFTILLFLGLRRLLNKKLFRPMEEITRAMTGESFPENYKGKVWKEAEELRELYRVNYENRQADAAEIIRLDKALRYAQEAEQNRRRLTNAIAHELKTPLAIIHSYAEGLQAHIAVEKQDRYLETILTESEKLDDMVMEMLDLSRLEAGRIKLVLEETDISALARDCLARYDVMSEEKKLEVTEEIPDTPPVVADEARIIQVMDNFLSNAVRYTPEGGKIHVSCEKVRNQVCFCVENTGRSFTVEELRKVWDTFYKTDASRNSKGSGLGLAIAKNVIELHGGSVFVNNTRDGVKFGFYLNL